MLVWWPINFRSVNQRLVQALDQKLTCTLRDTCSLYRKLVKWTHCMNWGHLIAVVFPGKRLCLAWIIRTWQRYVIWHEQCPGTLSLSDKHELKSVNICILPSKTQHMCVNVLLKYQYIRATCFDHKTAIIRPMQNIHKVQHKRALYGIPCRLQ